MIYLNMLENILSTRSYYFSYNHDLTHTLQRIHAQDNNPEYLNASIYERVTIKNIKFSKQEKNKTESKFLFI